jgi:hypothetical protein
MVDVIFTAFGATISRKIEMQHMPCIGDEVFVGLQRGVVARRWWNLEQDYPSILVDLTELNGGLWKDTKENWAMLLHVLNRDEWHWSGNFTAQLTHAWSSR